MMTTTGPLRTSDASWPNGRSDRPRLAGRAETPEICCPTVIGLSNGLQWGDRESQLWICSVRARHRACPSASNCSFWLECWRIAVNCINIRCAVQLPRPVIRMAMSPTLAQSVWPCEEFLSAAVENECGEATEPAFYAR